MSTVTPLVNGSSLGGIYWAVNTYVNDPTLFQTGGTYAEYGTIENWDTSQITNMDQLFKEKNTFTADLSNWNVSNVTSMEYMFMYAYDFNSDLSNWNVSKVTNMHQTFRDAHSFTSDISNWDVTSVTSFRYMFYAVANFTSDIRGWFTIDTPNLENMFLNATAFLAQYNTVATPPVTFFNQILTSPLQNIDGTSIGDIYWAINTYFNDPTLFQTGGTYAEYGIIQKWNVSQVTNMNNLFKDNTTFNDNISRWQVDNVNNMSGMFQNCTDFNQDITAWNVSNVTDFSNMFNNALSFAQNITLWRMTDISQDFTNMFLDAIGLQTTYSILSTPDVTAFNQPLPLRNLVDFVDETNSTYIGYDIDNAKTQEGDIYWAVYQYSQNASNFQSGGLYDKYGTIENWNVSQVTNMIRLFNNYRAVNEDISGWDVSQVLNMREMFQECRSFNSNLSNWNVGSVTNMYKMFRNCVIFNQPINDWNVSNVVNMQELFYGCAAFNQDISNWDVSNVTNFKNILYYCFAFDQPIIKWNVTVNLSTNGAEFTNTLFAKKYSALAFNTNDYLTFFNRDISLTPLENKPTQEPGDIYWAVNTYFNDPTVFDDGGIYAEYGTIDKWDVINVTNMKDLFKDRTTFNESIQYWRVYNVTDMSGMFQNCSAFNKFVGGWYTGNVTNMSNVFNGATIFNQQIYHWNTQSVTDLNSMFNGAAAFNQNIDSWKVENVTNMSNLFNGAAAFNQNLYWNTQSVTDMSGMFNGASNFNRDISSFNVSNVVNMSNMFNGATAFNYDSIKSWTITLDVNYTNMFLDAPAFKAVYDVPDTPDITYFNKAFPLTNGTSTGSIYWAISQYRDYRNHSKFSPGGIYEKYKNIEDWDTSQITSMRTLFRGVNASNFTDQIVNLEKWDTTKVTDMSRMFESCSNMKLFISDWDVSNVKDMNNMFNLRDNVTLSDLYNWNVSSVTNMANMFYGFNLYGGPDINIDLYKWNVSNVVSMSYMFGNCKGFNSNISRWDVSSVENMYLMFDNIHKMNIDLSIWKISETCNISLMFSNATEMKRLYNLNDTPDRSFFNQPTPEDELKSNLGYSDDLITAVVEKEIPTENTISNIIPLNDVIVVEENEAPEIIREKRHKVLDLIFEKNRTVTSFKTNASDLNLNTTKPKAVILKAEETIDINTVLLEEDKTDSVIYVNLSLVNAKTTLQNESSSITILRTSDTSYQVTGDIDPSTQNYIDGQTVDLIGLRITFGGIEIDPSKDTAPVTGYSSSSGDPHIFPLYGNMYELPPIENVYRLIQGKELIVNAITRKITSEERLEIHNYFTEVTGKIPPANLLVNGVFYKAIYIQSGNSKIYYDFDKKEGTTNSDSYFNIDYKLTDQISKYELSDKIKQIAITFTHKKYGKCNINLNEFTNPQIKCGISFGVENILDLHGLLIREYLTNDYVIDGLQNINYKKEGRRINNKKYTTFKFV